MVRIASVALAVVLIPVGVAVAGIPPAGFEETVVVSGISQITGFEWAPNGDLWMITKPGLVQRLPAGASLPETLLSLTVDTLEERGLLGIALDPDFAANGFVYLYYTVSGSPPHNRVSRFTESGDVLIGEVVLLEGPPLATIFHNAGNLRFGPDGLLYISMGDNSQPGVSQQLDQLFGKILRIAPDGSIPAGNPFFGVANARPEIWAYGLRNPWRFSIQPVTGTLFIGDVGDGSWEELDLGIAGANYGYPIVEGPQPPAVAGMTYPVHSYPHSGTSASITAGDHMVAGDFPPEYEGSYFYGDYARNTLFRLTLDASNQVVLNETFATAADSPIHIRVGPDGALYYAGIVGGAIYRIGYTGGANRKPIAVGDASPRSGPVPLFVQFDGAGSFDPDDDPIGHKWTFGDGGLAEQPNPSHTYAAPGIYNAQLEVFDPSAAGSTTVRIVAGNSGPTPVIVSPADGARFNAGDTIMFSATATDPEDGTLPAGVFSWTVQFHHGTHTHPFLGPLHGITSGGFTTADSGEKDPDVWYEIRLTVSDSGAPLGPGAIVSTTTTASLSPNLSTLSLQTSPRPDLAVTLDGIPTTGGLDVVGVVGLRRTLGALSPQAPGDGHTYTFAAWSDGGAISHEVITPAVPTTYTAGFVCDVIVEVTDLAVAANGDGTLTMTWTPPADPCLATGPFRYRIHAGGTARPQSGAGSFPMDPLFPMIGTATSPTFTFMPQLTSQYYLVVAIGSDGAPGPAGHYGD